ncbi:MAG: type II toxin-antitoxin system HicA family toxin [bacterium]|nr:type II toxin-antitoxin system HicA family toxin [bacterium]
MPELPVLTGKTLVRFLEYLGFKTTRTKGSHVRMKANDGRVTTVPVHGHRDIPKGLLRKIIREDIEISSEEFFDKYEEYKKRP